MRISLVFILFMLTINTQAEIHIWVDDKGNKHFSDSIPDHLKHKTSTVDYSSSIPTAAEREEAQRIYQQSKKHANSIVKPNRYEKHSIKDENAVKKEKPLTRNDKIKLRNEKEAKACSEYLASKYCSMSQAQGGSGCGNLRRPNNCYN